MPNTIKDPSLFDAKRPLDQELQMTSGDGLTVAAVGDCILSRPLSGYEASDPNFAGTLDLLRSCDVVCGNLETTLIDLHRTSAHPYAWDGDWPLLADPAVATDLVKMGFNLIARANNHALDWGLEGMRETTAKLNQAGLAHAGTGMNAGLARAGRFVETAKGRTGLVSLTTTYRPTSNALPPYGAAPARPGVNGLRLKQIKLLPAEHIDALERMGAAGNAGLEIQRSEDGRLKLFGQEFESSATPGYRHEMDTEDLSNILRAIRQTKQHADFAIVALHAHEIAADGFPELPAYFIRDLARQAIDHGADIFMTSGLHHLGPIEIYRDRPIYYGLGNFFWSDIQEPLSADIYAENAGLLARGFNRPGQITDADLTNLMNAQTFNHGVVFETVLPVSRFAGGRLSELKLYPIDLGYGRPLSKSGWPRLAAPETALRILDRLQAVCAAYGATTVIDIKDHVGTVRL